jgi:hypothetical protein
MNSESSLRTRFGRGLYTWAALSAVVIVFAGFARTYYLKELYGTPGLTGLVHLHGLVMTAWFLLFVVQVRLVESRNIEMHRRLGYAGAGLAVFVLAVGTVTAVVAAASGHSPGPPPLVFLSVPLGDMLVFTVFVGLGMAFRERGAVHKRLMLLSCLGILTAAIARIPWAPIHDAGLPLYFALTDLCVIVAAVVDTWRHRRFHPVFGWGLAFLVATHAARLFLSGTPQWLAFAKWVVGLT